MTAVKISAHYADGSETTGLDAVSLTSADGADTIYGQHGHDVIYGGGGDDTLDGGDTWDEIYAGDGDDTILLSTSQVSGEVIDGGAGNDVAYAAGTSLAMNGFLGTNTIETISGDGQLVIGDFVNSHSTFDFRGVDQFTGVASIDGGNYNDTIYGTDSADPTLMGGADNDFLYGGGGNDTLDGGTGIDLVDGEAGDDTLLVSGTVNYGEEFYGGSGSDRILAVGTEFYMQGFLGTNSVETIEAETDGLVIYDTINRHATFDFRGVDTFVGVSAIDGGNYNDTMYGTEGDDPILMGGADNDLLYGGGGNDTLDGGTGVDVVYGGDGDDTFTVSGTMADGEEYYGGNENDRILVSGSSLSMQGFLGSNTVETLQAETTGLTIADTINRNSTFDFRGIDSFVGVTSIDGGNYNDVIYGTETDDPILMGGADNDVLYGGGGNDTLDGGTGVDVVYGEAGDDTFTISDTMADGEFFDGGTGTDRILISGASFAMQGFQGANTVETIEAETIGLIIADTDNRESVFDFRGIDSFIGVTSIDGGNYNDVIYGTDTDDPILMGGAHNDVLYGGGGNDTLDGGTGVDVVYGEAGNDTFTISGTMSEGEEFYGGADTDRILISGATLSMQGFLGTNMVETIEAETIGLTIVDTANRDSVYDFRGIDSFVGVTSIDGGNYSDTIYGTDTDDPILMGGAHNDVLYGGGGNDTLDGGTGTDAVYGEAGNDTFTVSGTMEAGEVFDGGADTDRILIGGTNLTMVGFLGTNIVETIEAASAGLTIADTGNRDSVFDFRGIDSFVGVTSIDGGNYSDTIYGTDFGDPILMGGAHNDVLYGGGGDDILDGGTGTDAVYGEAGNDTFTVSGTMEAGEVFDGGADIDRILISGTNLTMVGFLGTNMVESIEAETIGLTIVDTGNRSTTYDFRGIDSFVGVDEVDGGNWHDTIYGTDGDDPILKGGADNDALYGEGGDDSLDGGTGSDVLTGGAGADTLTGGSGSDVFSYVTTAIGTEGGDTITDFNPLLDQFRFTAGGVFPTTVSRAQTLQVTGTQLVGNFFMASGTLSPGATIADATGLMASQVGADPSTYAGPMFVFFNKSDGAGGKEGQLYYTDNHSGGSYSQVATVQFEDPGQTTVTAGDIEIV